MKMNDVDKLLKDHDLYSRDDLVECIQTLQEWVHDLHDLIHDDLGVDIEYDQYVVHGQKINVANADRLNVYRDSGSGTTIVLESNDGTHMCDLYFKEKDWQDLRDSAERSGMDFDEYLGAAIKVALLRMLEEEGV